MAENLRIAPLAAAELQDALPLIAAYQRFYEVEDVDDERNRAFFARFLAPSDDGLLLGAWGPIEEGAPASEGEELLGFVCLYWHFTPLIPAETVLMNDLYVVEPARGRGIGRALIEASAAVGRERGAHLLQWVTGPENKTAQRLYDTTGAEREPAIEYELEL